MVIKCLIDTFFHVKFGQEAPYFGRLASFDRLSLCTVLSFLF